MAFVSKAPYYGWPTWGRPAAPCGLTYTECDFLSARWEIYLPQILNLFAYCAYFTMGPNLKLQEKTVGNFIVSHCYSHLNNYVCCFVAILYLQTI